MKTSLVASFCIGVGLASAQAQLWGQCGGIGWTGPTTCVAGAVCVYQNAYHMQCLAASSIPTTTSSIATEPTAPPGSVSIKSSCIDTRIQQNWFIGSCLTGKGNKRIQSSVYIGDKYTSSNGDLTWGNSAPYAQPCNNCQIQNISELNCSCPAAGKPLYRTTLNLGEHIANYKGHLLHNLSGARVAPTENKPRQFPGDVNWQYDVGHTSCANHTSPTLCDYITFNETCGGWYSVRTEISGCYSDTFYDFDQPEVSSVRTFKDVAFLAVDGAYKFQIWDNAGCRGSPYATIKAADYGKCVHFRKPQQAWSIVPEWNADL